MNESIGNIDVVIVGQQAWDTDIGSNCKNIAIELSKTNRVLFVNSPLDRITRLKGRGDVEVLRRINVIKKKESGLMEVRHNLWVYYPDCMVESINWINSETIFDFLNKRNNVKFAKSINIALEALGFSDYMLFNDGEIFKGFYISRYLKPILAIYYIRDYLIGVPYWKKHGTRLEPLLMKNSDLCFSNSQYLTIYCEKYNANSYNIGQGTNVEDFSNFKSGKPGDLKPISSKIIGYVGALSSARLDIDILIHIATFFPSYSLVLVGSEDNEFRSSELHKMPNVFFLGQKPIYAVPSYIDCFDVCINPQLMNDITLGNYPRKIDEYLLLGKPVVATKTVSMEIFKDHVYLAETKEDYVHLIQNAMISNCSDLIRRRIEFAGTHTWEKCVSDMFFHIQNTLSNKQSRSI
jgi:glycosyltransferase involved in cell wall biosynthesis